MNTPKSSPFRHHYPAALKRAELTALNERRARAGSDPAAQVVGVALSGGGIRSATFCLGLFQALARQSLIRRIDFLSTVSGGGYFGSFLGAAFSRSGGTVDSVESELSNNNSWSVKWLRENGRFLSPNGAGDAWMSAAVALRNWTALQIVLLSFSFLILGLGALIQSVAELLRAACWSKGNRARRRASKHRNARRAGRFHRAPAQATCNCVYRSPCRESCRQGS